MKPRTVLGARVLGIGLLFLVVGATATRADVVISQVYEGQESDRYVEVSNTGNTPINLSTYKLAIWRKSKSSGDASIDGITPSYAVLSGTLTAGASILLKNAGANNPSYAANSGVANASVDFDGNDAIAIVDAGDVVVDLFGVGINNRGQNFSRKPTAPSASAIFNAANWTSSSYSVANGASPGTGDYLGFYSFTVVVQPVLTLSPVAVAGLNATLGAPSASQSYVVAGSNLTTPVSIAVSGAAIEISTNSATAFTNAITVGAVGGSVSQTLYVRISAAAPLGVVSATVNHVSGTVSAALAVGGEVAAVSASKAGLRVALDYSVPANDFIGEPVGEVLTELNDTSGSVSIVQGLIDAARAANPDAFIRVRLKPNTVYTITGAPLVLGSKMCLSGVGTTLAANAATAAGSLVRITPGSSLVSVDRLTLYGAGKILHGIEAHGASRVNIDRVTVQDTGADGISLQGAGAAVFDNEMTVVRCTVYGVTGAAGIRVRDATQCIVMDNDCHNNATGIHLEASEHAAVVNNRLRYNSVAGVRLREAKNSRVASNLCEGNPTGVLTEGVASSYGYNFIFRNAISSAVTGIVLGQSRDALYGNEFPSGVSTPLGFAARAVNRVMQTGSAVPAVNQEYFHPPTASAWHSGPVKNGQARADVSSSATTLSAVQAAYDAARAANPGSVIVLRLASPVIAGDSALTLQSDTCVVIDGTIDLAPGVTAFVATGTAANPLGFISISGGVIDGQNTTGRSGMVFTHCGRILVEDVNLANFGSKATRVENSDVILFAGCKEPCIVDSCVISGGAARGIWTKGITGSSLSGMLFIDNVVSEVNMDGIDFDTATSSSSAFYNLCRNNTRYGIFVEEGAKYVQAVGNTCTGNDIGINVYSFDVGPTERNTFAANTLSANRRGLRFGGADTTPSTGLLTRNNFSFNNRIRNSDPLSAIDAQDDGSQNYVSQNVLSANAADYGSTSTAAFFNSPASSSSGADGAAYVNVDFTAYTDGVLVGQDGWLTYGSNNTAPVALSGGEVRLAGGLNYQAAYKSIAPYQFADNSSVHLRADINVQSAPVNGTDFFLVTRETDTVTGQPAGKNYFRLYVKSSGSGFQLGWNPHAETGTNVAPPVPTYADTVFSFNRDYRVVLRCDSVPLRNNDDTYLFVDPADSSAVPLLSRSTWIGNSSDEFSATLSTGTNRVGGSLNLVLKQQAATSTPLLSLGVKNIVVGDTLGDIGVVEVTESIPEPVVTEFTNSAAAGSVAWTSGPGWSATPVSSSNTSIRFQGTLGGNLTIAQDTGNNFVLNALTNANTGAFAMNFAGGAFEFRKKDTVNPVLVFANSSSTVQRFSNNFVLSDTLTVNQAGATTSNSIIAGSISGAGGVRKSGNGHVYLTGTNNSFGGPVTNSAGVLIVAAIGHAGANSSLGTNGTIVMGDGSGTNALRTISATAEASDKVISLGGSTVNTRIENYSGGILTLHGAINTVTNTGKTLYILARSNNVVLAGSIATNAVASNNLALSLTNSTNRTLTLSASNAFRGGVTIESGILEAAHPASLGNGEVSLAPSVPDGAILKVSYDGTGVVLGNLLLQNDAIIDAGGSPASSISFAAATNWTAGKFLTVSNSTVGRIYITNTNGVALDHIKSAEFPTYSAILGSAGLLEFLPPPPSGTTYVGWLASAGATATPESLFEYAYGAPAPGSADPQYSPAIAVQGEMLVLTYHVRQGAIGLTASPEVSVALDSLGAGFGPSVLMTDVSTGLVSANGVLLDRREASIPISIFGAQAFLRVTVTQQ